jgi:hypothetical protein
MTDGQNLGMVDGKNITIKMVNGKPTVNGTVNIIASVPASNGMVHVVDGVNFTVKAILKFKYLSNISQIFGKYFFW